MKKIVLTGGGSSGHVTPNIALVPELIKNGFEVHYIGSKNGIEKELIEKEGIPYHAINAGKLRRYMDFKNVTDIIRVIDGLHQAYKVIGRLKPDAIFSKGGFVSCPVVWAAWLRKVPVVIHESDMTPGLTNRLSMPFAGKVCYTFPESAVHIPKDKRLITGIPIRKEITGGNRKRGLNYCGFTDEKPVLMVIGGSLGSENINKTLAEALQVLLRDFQICHICGKGNIRTDLDKYQGYKQFEYVNKELPDLFSAADVIISRAGATTLYEILLLRKPNLLIPLSKNASRGDQILNAQSFQKQGFSEVLFEEELTSESLTTGINEILVNKDKYINAMSVRNSDESSNLIIKALIDVIN